MKSRLVQSRAANRKEAMSYWVDVVGTKVDLLILIVIEGMRNKDICGPHSSNSSKYIAQEPESRSQISQAAQITNRARNPTGIVQLDYLY